MAGTISAMHHKLLPSIILLASGLTLPLNVTAQTAPKPAPATLRSTLLAQLHSTHDKADWSTPPNAAVAGLTPEQARWIPPNAAGKTDPNANHSVGMLATHLVFWNERALTTLRGEKPAPLTTSNDETFNNFDATSWTDITQRLDRVMTALEQLVETAPEEKLARIAPTIANISTHNAYHTGQILYVRKLQGSWNPANGVK
jgi:hypothetical protein